MAPNDRGQLMGAAAMSGMREIELLDDEDRVSQAIADTEKEIWNEANAVEPDDNSGDRELEGMDADFDGNLQKDDTGDIASDAGDDDQQELEEPGEDDEEIDATAINDQVDDRVRADPQTGRVPSGRFREVREDRDRMAQELAEARERLARLEGQLQGMSQQAKPGAQQPEADPDPVIDPAGFKEAVRRDMLAEMQRHQQQQAVARLDMSLRSVEQFRPFDGPTARAALERAAAAGQAGDRIAAQNVRAIVNANDPGAALMEWWDREYAADYWAAVDASRPRHIQGGGDDRGQGPRQVTRGPRSLNGAGGRSTMRSTAGPNDLDGSDRAIFDYAMKP